ncbi:MAG: VWA domain-containing protein [Spirochaetales bacterium]|nr:VWA domain-containing protein [Spirochaetales bacterium]
MKKLLLIVIILSAAVIPIFAEINCISQNDGSVTFTVTISSGAGVNNVCLNYEISPAQPSATFHVDSALSGQFTAPKWYLQTDADVDDDGYYASYNKASDNPGGFYLRINPNQGSEFGATDTLEWKFIINGLVGQYELTCIEVKTDGCTSDTGVSVEAAPCTVFDSIKIQSATGDDIDSLTSYSIPDTADIITLYANAYKGTDYVDSIPVDWTITGDFSSDDIDIAADKKSVQFKPNNSGTSGEFKATYDTPCNTLTDTITSVTVAGPLHHIKIVDASDPPVEITSPQVKIDSELELFAGGYDINGYYRKPESVTWSYTPAPVPLSNSILSTDTGSSTKIQPSCESGLQDIIVMADHTTAASDTTGTISIIEGDISKIGIKSNLSGTSVPSSHPLSTASIPLFAFNTDTCGNPISQLSANWEIEDSFFTGGATGSLSAASGTNVTFSPPGNNIAGWAKIKISDGVREGFVTITILPDNPSTPSNIRLMDSSEAGGAPIDHYVIEVNEAPVQVYAVGFDQYGNHIGPINVSWATPILGSAHSVAPAPVPDSDNAVFDHGGVIGLTQIKISTAGMDDYTGDITVLPQETGLSFDVVQVLDHSGSMSGAAFPGSGAPKKIDAMKDAADYFVNLIKADSGKSFGLVIFDDEINQLVPVLPETSLSILGPELKKNVIETIIPGITTSGLTSIGGGLIKGMEILDTGTTLNKSMLLLTDGKENRSPWIDDFIVQYESPVAHGFPLQIIALGYDVGVNGILLRALLDELDGTPDDVISRGSYTLIENNEDLPLSIFKAFNQVLVHAGGGDIVNDPVLELRRGDPPVSIPISIMADQKKALFSVFWQGAEDSINIRLIAPNGAIIDKYTAGNRIRYVEDDYYKFIELLFPLSSRTPEIHGGDWIFEISISEKVPAGNIIKTVSAVSSFGGVKMDADISSSNIYTGESVLLTAELTRTEKPVSGAYVIVECDIPVTSAANTLVKKKYDDFGSIIHQPGSENEVTALDDKIQFVESQSWPIVRRSITELRLYDDGSHDDRTANDGIYTNSFIETTVPGSYNFRFIASEIPGGDGETVSREITKSMFNVVNVGSGGSDYFMTILESTMDGNNYNVEFTPKDKYGNHLGPGFPLSVSPVIDNNASSYQKKMTDNLNGTYSAELFLTYQQLQTYPKVIISLDDKRVSVLEVRTERNIIDFINVEKPAPLFYQGQASMRLGSTIPLYASTTYGPGISGMFDFGYSFTPDLTLSGIVDYDYLFASTAGNPNLHFIDICLDLKQSINLAKGGFKGYALGGGGVYFPGLNSFDYGLNGGLGFEKRISEHLYLDLNARYHYLLVSQYSYLQLTAGFVCKFQLIY